jgi:hypothetical protein
MSVVRLKGFLGPLAIVLAAGAVVFGVLVAGAQAGNTHPAGIPGSVKRVLLERAKSLAAENGDSHPYDIQAVRTTEAKAGRLRMGSSGQVSANEPVYIVALRGHFRCGVPDSTTGVAIPCMVAPGPAARHPQPSRTYSVGVLQIAAATMEGLGRGTDNIYPDLKRVGVPVRLG